MARGRLKLVICRAAGLRVALAFVPGCVILPPAAVLKLGQGMAWGETPLRLVAATLAKESSMTNVELLASCERLEKEIEKARKVENPSDHARYVLVRRQQVLEDQRKQLKRVDYKITPTEVNPRRR
jgi:hypothetical protein